MLKIMAEAGVIVLQIPVLYPEFTAVWKKYAAGMDYTYDDLSCVVKLNDKTMGIINEKIKGLDIQIKKLSD